MLELRPKQQRAINDLRTAFAAGHRRVMLCMPTGSGKTVVAAHIAMSAKQRQRKVLFLVHLKTLVTQAVKAFELLGLKVGIMQSENTRFSPDDDVIVASIQTLVRRKKPDWIKLIVIDEAHILFKGHISLIERWNAIPVVGLSATPLRKGLGDYFGQLVVGATPAELIDDGHLVPSIARCPDAAAMEELFKKCDTRMTKFGRDYDQRQMAKLLRTPKLVGDIGRKWLKYAGNRPTLAFAADKAMSRAIVEEFEGMGVAAAHVEDKTPDEKRREIFSAFREKQISVISSVGVTAIGFDEPSASCIIMARKTMSLALHIQMLGRGLRPFPGKENCLILDHVGNVVNLGLPDNFSVGGFRDGFVGDAEVRKRIKKTPICKECETALPPGEMKCPACGADMARYVRPGEYINGELVELGKKSVKESLEARVVTMQQDYLMLLWFEREMQYKRGWAIFAAKHKYRGEFIPGEWARLKPIPPDPSMSSWIASFRRHRQAVLRGQAKKRAAREQSGGPETGVIVTSESKQTRQL